MCACDASYGHEGVRIIWYESSQVCRLRTSVIFRSATSATASSFSRPGEDLRTGGCEEEARGGRRAGERAHLLLSFCTDSASAAATAYLPC